MRHARFSAGVLGLIGLFVVQFAAAAPKAELWERWTAHDAGSTQVIDHQPWQTLLSSYVRGADDGVNRVDYAGFSAADRRRLDDYIQGLAGLAISGHNRDQQLAYWINLYNALTVKVILDHYPVDSIRDIDISPGFFSDGPWGRKLLEIEGQSVSLDDIEHRILRPIWRDPRIHYAVNCASIGCPNLRMQAFTADNSDALLTQGARDYVNHPRGAELRDGELIVSSIYEWFKSDFGGTDAGVIAHLRQYAEPGFASRLASVSSIDDDRYDWSLNGLAAAR